MRMPEPERSVGGTPTGSKVFTLTEALAKRRLDHGLVITSRGGAGAGFEGWRKGVKGFNEQ